MNCLPLLQVNRQLLSNGECPDLRPVAFRRPLVESAARALESAATSKAMAMRVLMISAPLWPGLVGRVIRSVRFAIGMPKAWSGASGSEKERCGSSLISGNGVVAGQTVNWRRILRKKHQAGSRIARGDCGQDQQFCGGGSRIRTHEGVAPLTAFKTAAFNHSAIPPRS